MTAVVNLIPVGSSRFPTSIGSWTSPLGSALGRSTTQVFERTGYPSLQVTPVGSDNAAIEISSIHVPFDGLRGYRGFRLRAFAWVWTPTPVEVEIYLTTQSISASTVVTTSEFTRSEQWTLMSVESDPISDSESTLASLRINFNDLGAGNTCFVAIPTVMSPDAIRFNIASRESWIRLPEYIRNADESSEDPDLTLLRFIEVLTTFADDVDQTWSDFRYVPPEDNLGEAIPSQLVSPSIATERILRWLAPIMGTNLFNPFSGFTPWENFEASGDANADGVLTWDEFEASVDTDADDEATWEEIENFDPSITGLIDFERWQISSAAYGLRGGTTLSIEQAAAQAFPGQTKTVTVVPHYAGDPFAIAVTVSDTTSEDVGKIEEFVAPAIPAGFGLTVIPPV